MFLILEILGDFCENIALVELCKEKLLVYRGEAIVRRAESNNNTLNELQFFFRFSVESSVAFDKKLATFTCLIITLLASLSF